MFSILIIFIGLIVFLIFLIPEPVVLVIDLHDACVSATHQRVRVFDLGKVKGYDVALVETLKHSFLDMVHELHLAVQDHCGERLVPVGTLAAEHCALLEGKVEAGAQRVDRERGEEGLQKRLEVDPVRLQGVEV